LAKDKIVLLSTHIVSDIECIADQIMMMKKGKLILSGTTAELTEQANGLAWNLIVNPNQLEQYEASYCISILRHTSTGVELRIVSEKKPAQNAQSVTANIEDLFLYHFADELGQTSRKTSGGIQQ
jgi:ABC-2 type transport system ATP-binding protein